jgi:hypothetical protein
MKLLARLLVDAPSLKELRIRKNMLLSVNETGIITEIKEYNPKS